MPIARAAYFEELSFDGKPHMHVANILRGSVQIASASICASDLGLNPATFPPYLAGTVAGLDGALNAILGTLAVQNTISVGSRWDVMKNVDLKLQYDHIDLGAGSAGTLFNVQPDFQRGGAVNLVSIAVDFVW